MINSFFFNLLVLVVFASMGTPKEPPDEVFVMDLETVKIELGRKKHVYGITSTTHNTPMIQNLDIPPYYKTPNFEIPITILFRNCLSNISAIFVNLPYSIEIIEDNVFSNSKISILNLNSTQIISLPFKCFEHTRIKQIYLPKTLKCINEEAFSCSSIKKVMVSSNLREIKDCAFFNCCSLQGINLSKQSLTNIPLFCFKGCTRLNRIFLPNIYYIGRQAFYGCVDLLTLNFSELYITEISDSTFFNCHSLKSIVLPSTLKIIGEQCFENCTSLRYINLENRTFYSCVQMKELQLPHNVNFVGEYSFYNTRITRIIISNKCQIMKFAFANNYQLTSIDINVSQVNDHAFAQSQKLLNVTIKGSISQLDETVFLNSSIHTLDISKTKMFYIPEFIFSNLYNMYFIKFTQKIIQIGANSFANSSLRIANLSYTTLITIDRGAFENCTKLSHLTLPPTLMKIGAGAFPLLCSAERRRRDSGLRILPVWSLRGERSAVGSEDGSGRLPELHPPRAGRLLCPFFPGGPAALLCRVLFPLRGGPRVRGGGWGDSLCRVRLHSLVARVVGRFDRAPKFRAE